MNRVALVLLGVLLSGCRSAPRATPRTPDDFSISISVAGDGTGELAPAWYLVEADGVLRATTGVRSPRSATPPPVRTLTRGQVDELWELARAAGLAGRGAGTDPGTGACEIELASNGRRRLFEDDPEVNPGLAPLVRRLRELAWVSAPVAP
ncbi:hypothetical protein PHYC_03790 [Phycisphaerales bacterium]|nr:hypothetical protein PHYC_03790 [Phycisphaerales bacterium]